MKRFFILILSMSLTRPSFSYEPAVTDATADYINPLMAQVDVTNDLSCLGNGNANFALNDDSTIDGRRYERDTHFSLHRSDLGIEAVVHHRDGRGEFEGEDGTSFDIIEMSDNQISCDMFTQIPLVENEDGELELGEYSLPIDFKTAGTAKKRKRKGGVTYCYREVKRIMRNKITLTGASAYMANDQLVRAGWKKYTNYSRAPAGAVCVFGKGGKVTSSGGHKHGHIGIKGRTGVINPQAGFNLGRPFLGCYTQS